MQAKQLTVLGIETSCDETAASIVTRNPDGSGKILSNIVRTQLKEHAAFGGVVPEIAARAHTEVLETLIAAALKDADCTLDDMDVYAATSGPGLIGGLLVGTMITKAIARVKNKPYLAINHLEGHALTVGLTHNQKPPYLLLLVSGGHTQLLWVSAIGSYSRMGSTIDDALGEAFDKTAKLLGLGYPGGPEVERWATKGNPDRFQLPQPLKGEKTPNFSFSGLKTALRQQAQKIEPLTDNDIADLCAGFQKALINCLLDRLQRAIDLIRSDKGLKQFPIVVAGGVAANQALRTKLEECAIANALPLIIPPFNLCTDNAAMIAWAGAERFARGEMDPLDKPARARWPLDETAIPLIGAGKGGPKA